MKSIAFAIHALCMVLSSFVLSAQNSHTLSGSVLNNEKKALPDATVSLLHPRDSTLIKATLTDANGKFEFDAIKSDTVLFSVSFVGFNRYYSGPVIFTSEIRSVVWPVIELSVSGAGNLQTALVVGRKNFIERKIDRTIVNPDALISNAGANALEVLEKSPGVQVDMNGIISLKGKQGVTVFIDDKPTHLSAGEVANYLRSLPATTINTIEIMTNPPAMYDAQGNAGVINIRLKKLTTRGMNAAFNTSYGQAVYTRNNNSLNFNYRINKVNFFGVAAFNTTNDFQKLNVERQYMNSNGSLNYSFKQNSFIKNRKRSGSLRLGADFYLSPKSTAGIVVNGFVNPTRTRTNSDADILNASGKLDSMLNAASTSKDRWRNGGVNINYNRKIGNKGTELTINADYIGYRSITDQSLTTTLYDPLGAVSGQNILISDLPVDITIRTAKADYTTPFKNGRLEAGLKKSNVETHNTANYYDRINGLDHVNNDLSNEFKYTEDINAAYLNYNRDFKRLSLQAGLRFEHTLSRGNQLGNSNHIDSSFRREYSGLFPTFYLNYKFDSVDRNQIGFSYGRRIERPSYQDLNPFTYPLDKYTYFSGNPFIQPTYSDNIELSHSYKNKITTTLQFSRISNIIQEIIEQDDSIFISKPGNIKQQINAGVSVNVSLNPVKWWSMQAYTEFIHNSFKWAATSAEPDLNRSYWLLFLSNQFTINSKYSGEVGGFYKTGYLSGQFLNRSIYTMRMGLQRKILKDNGTLKLTLNDIFYSFQVRGNILNVPQATASFRNRMDSRIFTIAFSYRFKKGKGLAPRESGAADTEKDRVKMKK